MHIHFIQHEIFEAPGAYLDWAISRNHKVSFTKVFEYNLLPETVENIDVLIVMGGPQSPNTSKEECPYFDAKAEINFIRKMINNRKAVVGACLGAQLIGEAMGAAFERSPEKEIGVLPITLTQEGLRDNKIKHFGNIVKVGHWHSDMPGLTEKCNVLAKSFGCPRQIISYSNLVYGFQCHPEFTPEVVEMEEGLAESLGTRVTIEPRDKGGKISIDYFSYDELLGLSNVLQNAGLHKLHKGMFDKIREEGANIGAYVDESAEVVKEQIQSESEIAVDDRGVEEKNYDNSTLIAEATDDDAALYSGKAFTI